MLHPYNPVIVPARPDERHDDQAIRLMPGGMVSWNPTLVPIIVMWIEWYEKRLNKHLTVAVGGKTPVQRAQIAAQKEYARHALGALSELIDTIYKSAPLSELQALADEWTGVLSTIREDVRRQHEDRPPTDTEA